MEIDEGTPVQRNIGTSGSFIGEPPGSLIPRKRPMAIATKMIAESTVAAKLKRRSVNTLRNRGGNNNRVPVVMPRMQVQKSVRPATASNRAAASNVQRNVKTGVGREMASSSFSRPVTNHHSNSNNLLARRKPEVPPAMRRPPFRMNNMVKAAAVEAVQKKKPPPFVSRREQQLQKRIEVLERETNELTESLSTGRQENESFRSKFMELSERANRDSSALISLQALHTQVLEQLRLKQQLLEESQRELANVSRNFTDTFNELRTVREKLYVAEEERKKLKDKLWKSENEQRSLRNQVLELKGNIRVFCRVRPLLSNEFGIITTLNNVSFPENDDKKLDILKGLENVSATPMGGYKNAHSSNGTASTVVKHSFEFDKVFGPDSTQSNVFEEISHLVQSAIDGYNVCVFAYGQTGSGKTFTMEGPAATAALNCKEQFGMIELSACQIFDTISKSSIEGWEYTVEASFIEIYNESVLDLLAKDPKNNEKLEIKMLPSGSGNIVDVANLTKHTISSVEEFKPLLSIAQRNRTIAATKCNDRSSRSHSVFRLRLCGANGDRGVSLEGTVNLVDLAGSECLKKSESEGQQLKEAKNINRSLMTLGKVIMALVNGDSHIPYRESKLTYLLQNSLGGNSRTLMFVNISPEPDCVNESLNSLRFATQVNQCHLGTATKNVFTRKAV